jgi:predicted DNA-binding ArsR family transcriptional regulator
MAKNLAFQEIFDGGESGSVIKNLDTTLKISGKAADAKAVGDALADKVNTSVLANYAKTTDLVQLDTSLSKQGYAAESKATGLRLSAVEDWIEDTGSQHATRTDLANHNTDTTAHNDMRIELKALADRINAVLDSDDTTLDELSEIVAYIKSNKALIEQVTSTKVNIADIIDNLTSNVTNKPLSAAQGVALKALIDAIAVPTRVSQLTNDAQYVTETELSGKGETWTFKLKDGSTVTKKVVLA